MTIEKVKLLSNKPFTPIDIILEWNSKGATMMLGTDISTSIDMHQGKLALESESVDKVIIHCKKQFELDPAVVLLEAKRVLKRNGRLFLSFYNTRKKGAFSKIFSVIGDARSPWSIDSVADIIRKNDLLIDKNILVEDDLIYFEIIKLENERLGQLIYT